MVLEQAKLEARQNGANVVKITEHKRPNIMSTCHRMKVTFYCLEDTSVLPKPFEEPILEDVDYALLHVYRSNPVGALIGYDLMLGDSTLCRVKNNFMDVIHITAEGPNLLWAKTEKKTEVPITLEHGKSYFLECGIKAGVLVGRPTLELIDYRRGKEEYERLMAKKARKN